MLRNQDSSDSLICAVREGKLELVRELISSYGLSYSQAWSGGYILLRDAVANKHTEVAKLLLTNGSKVNSKSVKPTDTPLHFAVTNGDIEIVKMLLDRGANINAKNGCGITPLHNVFGSQKMEIIELLVNQGADLDATDNNCITPFHLALERCSDKIIKLLLSRVANVNAKRKDGRTYIHIAAERGYLQIVDHLLKRGAYVNSAYTPTYWEGYTPLCLAVKGGHEKVVQLLLECGANVNAQGKDGKTVLHFAVETGHEKVVKLLLECGAKVDAQDKDWKTVLHFAVETGHEVVVKLLLECGAKFDAQDKDGKTVLHFAVEKGHKKVVKLLLECGANFHAQDKGGKTVLHLAVEKGHEKVVKLLLECGAKVDAQDKGGKTVLHFAVEKGHSVIIEHVLKHCPDVNNKSNRSALNVAVHGYVKEYGKIIENLLQYGFTVKPEDVNNCKLLHAAVEKGYLKIVEELLIYGIDVNKLYKSTYGIGYMPLHVAAKNKQEEVDKLLISYEADVNAKDETGKTPIFYATQNADLKITRLLLTNKANIKDNPELLNIAVLNECIEIVEVLLEHGADVNAIDVYGRTALHFTALGEDGEFFGNSLCKDPDTNVKGEIAKLLLSRGANVNAQTKAGITTLHAATYNGYVKVVEALLEHNADVNCTVKTDITPPCFDQFLLISHASIGSKGKYDGTPLHIPAEKGHLEIIKGPLKFGAIIDSKDKYGTTALHFAAVNGHLEVVKILLKFGAIIDSKDESGKTALHIACRLGHKQIVIPLLEHGSDVNIMSKDNFTPLDFAGADNVDFYRTCHHPLLSNRKMIADILKCHMVKMKTANLFLSEKNLLSISSSDEISDFQKACEEEIAIMKSEVSNANVSFYDILTKGISQLAMYAGNESIVQILRSDDYKTKFPIYGSMINSNFRKGKRRKELLEQGNRIFHFLFNNFPRLPHDCTERIFSYLSDEDVRILIDACKPISVSSPNTDDNVITSSFPKIS